MEDGGMARGSQTVNDEEPSVYAPEEKEEKGCEKGHVNSFAMAYDLVAGRSEHSDGLRIV